jgi:heme A synthase
LSRAASISAHLVNTFLLLGALTLTGFWATKPLPDPRAPRAFPWPLIFGLLGLIVVGVLGAIAALGDTLFPSQSLAEGFQGDFAPTAHLFVRVRVWHPVLAVAVALYLLIASQLARGSGVDRSLTAKVSLLVVVQIGVGLVNLGLLAPIWTQLIHLLIADLLFIALVRLTAASLSATPSAIVAAEPSAASAP